MAYVHKESLTTVGYLCIHKLIYSSLPCIYMADKYGYTRRNCTCDDGSRIRLQLSLHPNHIEEIICFRCGAWHGIARKKDGGK
ncbi:MAG: hypothetical protein [Circoviridae sp.]|nr:MAG: hypothetical protein [Circoviridae sp.]